jgi:transposase
VFESVATALAETMAESGHCNIDSTTVRAHVSAAGGKGRFINELLAARGAGSPVNPLSHCLSDARGRPIAFDLAPGEAVDCKTYDTLIDLPEHAPDALLADEAYDTDAIRDDLKKRGINAVIPPIQQAPLPPTQLRRACNRPSQNPSRRRHALDQLAHSFLAMLASQPLVTE